ncbi:MAG: spore coat protein CotH [Clostridium butyricum]|nr:spore coat protein CotH [Clostridium butyricum]
MIKEKYKWCISIILMALAVLSVVAVILSDRFNTEKKTEVAEKVLSKVLDKDNITQVSIDIDESDWKWLLENATDEEYRNCNITINGTKYYNVGIRPKGNTSLTNVASDNTTDRYSFKIKFDENIDGQSYNGIKSIVLNNIIQDNTYMKEYITYDLFSHMGVATPEMSYSNVIINNKSWGLYLAIEVVDERYLQNNFGTIDGNLYKPETMGVNNKDGHNKGTGANPPDIKDFMKGERSTEGADFIYIDDEVTSYSIVRDSAIFKRTTDDDFKKVINMYQNLNDGTNLEEVLDVEEVLKYFAVNTFVINLDSYSGAMYHNYYLYENNGKCQILPWDLNLSFAGYEVNKGGKGENFSQVSTINFPIDNPVSGNLENMPLIGKLLEIDKYKELYHSYLQQIADEYFNSGYYENLVNKLDNMISEYVKQDPTAFCTYDKYKTAVNEMVNFGKDRTVSVIAQLNGEQPSTTYGNIQATVNIFALGDMGGGMDMKDKANRGSDTNLDMPQNNFKDDVLSDNPEYLIKQSPNNKEKDNVDNINVEVKPANEMYQSDNKFRYILIAGMAIFGLVSVFAVGKFKRKKYLK